MQKLTLVSLSATALLMSYGEALALSTPCPMNQFGYTCPVDNSADLAAVCNDGTTPAFWYRPSPDNSSTWVIWLEGGSDCLDNASCAVRASASPQLLTSKGFAATAGSGITSASSTQNPRLYDANTVVVHYCSSDTWSGQKMPTAKFTPNNAATGWSFQGRAIAEAAVTTLRTAMPAFQNATRIVMGGDSAGGEGITITINDLLPHLPKSAQVLLVNDAGFALHIGQYDPTAPSPYVYAGHPNLFETSVKARLAFWQGRGDAICDAQATTTYQHGACYDSAYVLQNGYINLPTFVAGSQLDTAQLQQEMCPAVAGKCTLSHTRTNPTGIYATAFAAAMKKTVTGAGTAASYTGFTPDQYMHVILASPIFATPLKFPSGLITPQAAFDAWLDNPTAPPVIHAGNSPGVAGPVIGAGARR